MKYTIVWRKSAESRLAELYATAVDRQAITDACNRIERDLKNDPDRRVRVKDGLAFYRLAPLIVALEILPDDRIVRVLNVDVL
jgi:hypothetical protein